ncbi:MAG TPA: glycoside hydrolase family 6 protein, partial [Candidatus Saccharimonadales bacterium]
RRTSAEAAVLDAVPVYQLYAIPARDACAAHSRGGFANSTDYLNWIDRIIEALSSDAVIAVEADAIAHAVGSSCMSEQQQNDRYALLKQAIMRLSHASRVTAIYLDAGHPEWLPNPADLVRPLQQSGVEYTRGIAVNVSFFTETNTAAAWSQKLLQLLGGEKAAIIDTSRNGRGVYGGQGDARWCNPPGRGVGLAPTTQTGLAGIDAYFWGKNIGESDGDCGGYPAAGVFVPKIALELARNARQ